MTISDELGKLGELHQRGVLSDEEFARAKARVLGDNPRVRPAPGIATVNALRRSRTDRWIGGVCGGLTQISGVDAWIWRLIFAVLAMCAGTGFLVYLLLWIFVPEDESDAGANHGQFHAG